MGRHGSACDCPPCAVLKSIAGTDLGDDDASPI